MKKLASKKYLIGILCLFIIIGFIFRNHYKNSNNINLTAPITRGNIIEAVYGIGTVKANRSYELRVGIAGNLQNVFVREGDEVMKGQKLVSIDGNVMRAPFKGVLASLPFKEGEIVFPQNVVLTLIDFTDRYMVVSLEQAAAIRVKQGQQTKLSFDSLRTKTFEGKVEAIYSYRDEFLARIGIAHLPRQILPGMTADVAIGISKQKNVLLIPVTALESGHVFIQDKLGQKKKIPVKIGIIDNLKAEILSGNIKEGDRLIIREKPGE